jgi:hypothetical protein
VHRVLEIRAVRLHHLQGMHASVSHLNNDNTVSWCGGLERILPSLRSYARTLHNAITSVRQAAEWGIGSMQKVYSQLNLPLSYDPELYGLRLNNIFRMSKFRVRTVGISQIRITFSGAMDLEASTSSACA